MKLTGKKQYSKVIIIFQLKNLKLWFFIGSLKYCSNYKYQEMLTA